MQTVEWKVLVLKVLFLVGVESIVATKKKAKEGGKAIFLCISLLPFRGESFQHHPFGQQNPIQPARAKLYGLDIYFTGCPKDSGTQSTKAAIRRVLKHTKDFPLLLYSIMLFYCLLQGASRRICLKRSLAIFKEFSENSLQILNFWRENSKSLQWAKYLFIILISSLH